MLQTMLSALTLLKPSVLVDNVSLPVSVYAKSTICDVLRNGLHAGKLMIQDGDQTLEFGSQAVNSPTVVIRVLDPHFWARIYFDHDLGLAEGYMLHEFETSDLKGILKLWVQNRDTLQGLQSYYKTVWTLGSAAWARLFGHTLGRAKLNASTGYDCSNTFFQAILSSEMMYSSALWPESTGGVRGDLAVDGDSDSEKSLEEAQLHKIHTILRKARVKAGDRVLEFGSGWGAMSIEAAKLGATVDTITLSVEQKKLADKRIRSLGLQDAITVHLIDYRNLPPHFKGRFDAFVSVEMVEAVGPEFLGKYYEILDWALKPDKAAAVITATTQPPWRFTKLQATDYARRYQWPHSYCPSVSAMLEAAESSTDGRLVIENVDDFTAHYPRTLREWGRRQQKNWTPELMERLLRDQPQLAKNDGLEIFKRKWEYMYVYAEVGYVNAYTTMHYFTFVRPENISETCD